MLNNLWNNILDWFEDRSERSNLVRSFNSSAKNAFISGVAPTLLKAKISKGNREFKEIHTDGGNYGVRFQLKDQLSLPKH